MSSIEQTVGIFTTDASLVIRSWDAWLARATGIAAEEARAKPLLALFPELEARGMIERFERVLALGTAEILASAFHHYLIPCAPVEPSARFDKMQQHVTISPLRETDKVVGTIVTIEDVTARLDRERDLAERLASPDEPTRLEAAQILAEGDAPSSSQELAGSLGDESWRVRRKVVDGLARKTGAEEVKILVRALRDQHRDPGVLNSALQVLALSGVDAIEPLSQLLNDEDVDLRIYSAHALGDQHDPRAVPALIRALNDADVNVRYHAIEALGKIRAVEAAEALVAVAESGDFFLAFPALDALRAIGASEIAPRLVPLLKDELLRSPATEALGRLGDEEVVAPLIAILNMEGAPAQVIAGALTTLHDRFEKSYKEGLYIADLVRSAINEAGVQNLLDAIDENGSDGLASLALVLGWLEGEAVERALVRLLGQSTARREVVEALVRYGERVTQLLVEQLRAEEVETRKAAVVALSRIGDPQAVPALVRVLTDDEDLAIIAAGALGKIGDRRAFAALLDLLSQDDTAVRQAAVAAINSLGHPEMSGRASELLKDPNPHIRESAVRIAGYFGYEECTDLLLECCRDEAESVRQAAIEHIPFLEDDRVVPILAHALESETPRVRAAAASAFAHIGSREARSYLLAALKDSDPWVRYFAVRSIGQHGYSESLEAVVELARTDVASQVRIAAVDSLGGIDEARTVRVLESFVKSQDTDLARAAMRSLGRINHPGALTPLLEALNSPDRSRRIEALNSLGNRGGEDAVNALQWSAAADPDADVARAAIDALAHLATPDAIGALINLTADHACRQAAIEALSQMNERHIMLIGEGLTHMQPSVRRAVVAILGRMKHPLASDLLSKALDDEEATVRLAAVNELAHLGSRGAERKLVSLVRSDPDMVVRRAAQKALRR